MVFARAFETDFWFTLRERKSLTLDQIQIDVVEVKENFTSARKFKGKVEHSDRRKGKEEANFFGQVKETQE